VGVTNARQEVEMNKLKESDEKRPYEPPRVVIISLRPEEAVLGHCKSPTGGTFAPGNCAAIIGLCNSIGS
jgi:hypothetical protein